MGLFDDLKRAGTRTYQSVMGEILGLTEPALRPVDGADAGRTGQGAQASRRSRSRSGSRPVIGLNTGAGGRWPLKAWREEGYLELIDRIGAELGAQFVLLGGPGEHERNARLKSGATRPVFDPGCDNPVRHFSALVAHCDLVVTGDTLAMHIALALGKRTIVLFGPTSAPEIELCGLGEKIMPDMTCLSCYKTSCDFVPNCMDLISTDMVAAAVRRQLDAPAFRATARPGLTSTAAGTRPIRCSRPPCARTAGASMHSSPYSAPLAWTSGRTASMKAMGSSSSKMWT